MLNIESKISGWKVTGFETKPVFSSQVVSLEECMKTIKNRKQWITFLTISALAKA